jgi:Spy/CpxP family protein refolding chaperone
MKKLISVLSAIVLMSIVAFAQPKNGFKGNKGPEQWRERMRAEQVAFITSELNLTEAEAQAFWPVYNDVQNKRRDAFKASAEAFQALSEGIEGDNVNKLLDKYLESKKDAEKIESEAINRFKKVLPKEKVAKLVLAEEKFRHRQISRLGQGKH